MIACIINEVGYFAFGLRFLTIVSMLPLVASLAMTGMNSALLSQDSMLTDGLAAPLSFAEFASLHGRDYEVGSSEYELRRTLYEARAAEVLRKNSEPGRTSFAAVNHLADRTDDELERLRGYKAAPSIAGPPQFLQVSSESDHEMGLPKAVDWRHLKAMHSVHNQGECGSCWAVATATTMTAHSEIHADHRSFSAQHLLQCVGNPRRCGGSGGCDGATPELALAHILEHGMSTAEELPYSGKQPLPPCPFHASSLANGTSALAESSVKGSAQSFGMVGWEKLPENEVLPILRALQDGPVNAAVSATAEWNDYSHGILSACEPNAVINHAVVLVGYGETPTGHKYWLIQNSWGDQWGEGGFLRLSRRTNTAEQRYCGWDNAPQDGSGCADGPSRVRVCGACGILYDVVRPVFGKSPRQESDLIVAKNSGASAQSSVPAQQSNSSFTWDLGMLQQFGNSFSEP